MATRSRPSRLTSGFHAASRDRAHDCFDAYFLLMEIKQDPAAVSRAAEVIKQQPGLPDGTLSMPGWQGAVVLLLILGLATTAYGQEWITPVVESDLVEQVLFHSEAVGSTVSYHVYLPEAYGEQPASRFPVLYWLHGSGSGWLGIPWLATYFHNAMTRGDIQPLIVVFPHGLPQGMWADAKSGLQPVASMLVGDLIADVDQRFRTHADRAGRLVEGWSMGGYGAGRMGLTHPELFAAFSMLGSGPLQLDFLAEGSVPLPQRLLVFEQVYGNDMAYFEALSPWRLAEQTAALGLAPRFRLIIGKDDALLQSNRAFQQLLDELELSHEYLELDDVGHDPTVLLQLLRQRGDWSFYAQAVPLVPIFQDRFLEP